MTGQMADRWRLAATGGSGGALVWAVLEAMEAGLLPERAGLVLVALVLVWFGAALAMAGPIGLLRSMIRGLALGAVVALLVWLASLRFAEPTDFFLEPMLTLATLAVATLPVPFLIGQARGDWRDYGALFLDAWSIAVRFAAAWAFAGLVWVVVFLSDQVLQIVGIGVIGALLAHWIVPMVITGAVLGLGMAVLFELADLLSPHLILRLVRLLLPVVLAVASVFLLALPFQGLSGLFGALSPALLLLTLVAVGGALVAIAVDQNDAAAVRSPVLLRSAQGLALVLPILAALAVWALWLRVAQYGWTPERLFVAVAAGLGLAYGMTYAVAVLRGSGWMRRIRQGNIALALAAIALAALWLSPVLNAERIAAADQLARFEAGHTAVADLDIAALQRWGQPGAAALARLEARATAPGQEALAARLAGTAAADGLAAPAVVTALMAAMPVQPATATGMRDTLLASGWDFQLRDWAAACGRTGAGGAPGCLMVVADLLPALPGEEAVLILEHAPDHAEVLGLYLGPDGSLLTRPALQADGTNLSSDAVAALLRAWREAPPPLTPALLNQLGTGPSGLLILP